MAERMYIQNGKARTQGNHTVTGSTCCATLPACNAGYESITQGACQPTPPTEFDVTLPTISVSSGNINCSAALCTAIFGKTYTVSYSTIYNNTCGTLVPNSPADQWVYAVNNYCTVSNTTAPYSGTDACLTVVLRITCNFKFGAGDDNMVMNVNVSLWDNTPLSNGSWNSWVWQSSINDIHRDCNTETFTVGFSTSKTTTQTPCAVAQYPGTNCTVVKH